MLRRSSQCWRRALPLSLSQRSFSSLHSLPYHHSPSHNHRQHEPLILTAAPLPSLSSSLSSGASLLELARTILIHAQLKFAAPKGFGNFIPRKDTDANSSAESKPSNDTDTDSDTRTNSDTDKDANKAKSTKSQSNKSSNSNNDKKSQSSPDFDPRISIPMALASVAVIYWWLSSPRTAQEITFQEFRNRFLETNRVDKLVVDAQNKTVAIALKPSSASSAADGSSDDSHQAYYFRIGSVEAFERALDESQRELSIDPHDFVQVKYSQEGGGAAMLSTGLQLALLMFLLYSITKGVSGGMSGIGGGLGGGGGRGGRSIFSIGKSPAQMVKPGEMTKISFKDVAGLDEAKVEVMEFVKFLKSPDQFTKLGAKIPKGALLVGPPGTGKTLLAKAMAGEASVPFFSISGSDFIEMFVGVGPSRVRDLFAEARKNAPCIIFIDEIDAVGRARGKGNFSGGHDERENTLNQLLVEMDGFATTEGVVVLAGTNRKDILDKALLRPGRFDRQILIDKPDLRGRTQIFLVHLKPLKVEHDHNDLASRLAALTPGFAGADIANLCNEAALIAARDNKEKVELVDFERATDRIIGGLEKQHGIMTESERRRVAYHEAGHAVTGWFLEHADPLLKVTIVPRGNGALGFAQYLPKELSLYTQSQLSDMMCMTLGGRAAEAHFFSLVSSGAADDLQKVTRIAQAQVSSYGMSEKLGQVSYHMDSSGENQFTKPFSEATAQTIDEEVRSIIATAYQKTQDLIKQHAVKVEELATELLRLETINHDVIVRVLGPRPFVTDAYSQFIKNQQADAEKRAMDQKAKSDESGKADKEKSDEEPQSPILTPI